MREISYVDINLLTPYAGNPRKNDKAVKSVANSIQQFGFNAPILVDGWMVIIAGHTRFLAAQQLGYQKVPVIILDGLTDQQIKGYRLADNKVSEIATWDYEKLQKELEGIKDIDMSLFDFDISSIINDEKFYLDLLQAPEREKKIKYDIIIHCRDETEKTETEKKLKKYGII